MLKLLRRLRIEPFVLILLSVVALASVLPCRGQAAEVIGTVADLAIALLFFLHGARLSSEAVVAGVKAWKVHGVALAATYVAFPILGLIIVASHVMPPDLATGMMFLCCLPSTVSSSIAFVSIARGNIPAAVCSATLSNMLGIIITPVLVAIFLRAQSGGFSWSSVQSILVQLVLPFAAGQVLRPVVGPFVHKHKAMLGFVDRGSILLVVYTAFSHAVLGGIWHKVQVPQLLLLLVACAILLAAVLGLTNAASKALGLTTEDEIAAVFCGSKKSLVTGVPMASALFPPATAGVMILPLMLFHQMQLIVCAVLAQRYARRDQPAPEEGVLHAKAG
jgi:sodium/bile acid cotransporter 7